MGARLRSVVAGLIVVVCLIVAGYKFNWVWTGFNEHIGPQVQQYQPAKTLWDWLSLLIVPGMIGFGTVWFTRQQGRVSDAENRDNQREVALQAYMDKIS